MLALGLGASLATGSCQVGLVWGVDPDSCSSMTVLP